MLANYPGKPAAGVPNGISFGTTRGGGFPNRTLALVKVDVAGAYLGRPAQKIFDLVTGGTLSEPGLLWVFNVARNSASGRRDLRFWFPELTARAGGEPARYHQQSIGWIVSQILPGNRQSFNAGDVNLLFQIRHRTRLDYGAQLPGRLTAAGNVYLRPALETFLNQRWIGALKGEATND